MDFDHFLLNWQSAVTESSKEQKNAIRELLQL